MAARFYVTQNGYWWSFAPNAFRRLIETGASGASYNLDHFDGARRLGRRPSRSQALFHYVAPLDFGPGDWTAVLAEYNSSGTVGAAANIGRYRWPEQRR